MSQVRGAVAFSPDRTHFSPSSWVLSPSPAYGESIALRNGSTLTAKRRQRPQLVFAEGPIEVGGKALPNAHFGSKVSVVWNRP